MYSSLPLVKIKAMYIQDFITVPCGTMSEKLCLQWNDFKENITTSFGTLRRDEDFADVTLACEDGKQVKAHKVILASSSQLFQKILKSNKHAHPLLYMRGMKSEDLLAILDFLYCGESNVYQENLDSFLAIAEELQLKGLMGKSYQGEQEIPTKPSEVHVAENAAFKDETRVTKAAAMSSPQGSSEDSQARTVAVANEHPANMLQLDEQINSLMTKSSRKEGKNPIYMCKVCGKEDIRGHMRDHIEANHLEGISITCNFCEKMFRTRNARRQHQTKYHLASVEQIV